MGPEVTASRTEEELRKLPSVDRLLQEGAVEALAGRWGHELTVAAVRETLDTARRAIRGGEAAPPPAALASAAGAWLAACLRPTLHPVINATGVIIHTNLGRAPLSAEARAAMDAVAAGYSNLEYDLEAGERGSRYVHAEELLCRLTGAEAALVVNNNAAAVLLVLMALAQGREVIISRGQLVEIGGGFRIPDVMRQSGARLVEVGTTNRTYIRDYEAAISAETAALMRVHHSNFRLVGFATSRPWRSWSPWRRSAGCPCSTTWAAARCSTRRRYGLAPRADGAGEHRRRRRAGHVLSGDKLLGGPQAGIIAGPGRPGRPAQQAPARPRPARRQDDAGRRCRPPCATTCWARRRPRCRYGA